jgi:translation elongation factor EF-G
LSVGLFADIWYLVDHPGQLESMIYGSHYPNPASRVRVMDIGGQNQERLYSISSKVLMLGYKRAAGTAKFDIL